VTIRRGVYSNTGSRIPSRYCQWLVDGGAGRARDSDVQAPPGLDHRAGLKVVDRSLLEVSYASGHEVRVTVMGWYTD
jgi:hypothetical protein